MQRQPSQMLSLHVLVRLLDLPGPHYVLFMADPDPATGVSWCPDCVRCGPAVKEVMADKKAALLEVLVGPRQVWKDPQHPLRWVLVTYLCLVCDAGKQVALMQIFEGHPRFPKAS